MTVDSYAKSGKPTQCNGPESPEAAARRCDTAEPNGALDGSVGGLTQFLRELVEMTDPGCEAQTVPVLELQFGDIFTSTVLSAERNVASLAITALLPRLQRAEYLPLSSAQVAMLTVGAGQWECLWHADGGHYVVVRNILITDFPDERSVMDAIADTSDQVAQWCASIDMPLPLQ